MKEKVKDTKRQRYKDTKRQGAELVSLSQIKSLELRRVSAGIEEMDRVLGGPPSLKLRRADSGIVPGSVILLAGDPGIGKSTLLLQMADSILRIVKKDHKQSLLLRNKPSAISHKPSLSLRDKPSVLYVSGEESPQQIKIRAKRLGIQEKNLLFLNETNVDEIIRTIDGWMNRGGDNPLSLVIIDSIQTMWTSDLTGTAGSVGQVRESARRLLDLAKANQIPLIMVGHVTKVGAIAGPMVLAHMVDTVLFLEGERYQALRILRSIKNRFGPTDEVGVFNMTDKGMEEVSNPSKLFLAERRTKVPGSVVTVLMEGTRPLLVEIQALTVPTQLAMPRRVASGVDWKRVQLLIAVLTRRAGLPLGSFDVFVNVAGGIKVSEPGADLAICLAIASAFADRPINPKAVAVGEVGLLGELRPVGQLDKRLKEARRLGFAQPVTPKQFKTVGRAIKKVLEK
jgi:DNA repair protein RadA/Sms